MYSFFAYIDRMKYINRWSLMRSTERENLMEHSAQVAIIAHALAVIGNTYFGKNYDEKSVAALALFLVHGCVCLIRGRGRRLRLLAADYEHCMGEGETP